MRLIYQLSRVVIAVFVLFGLVAVVAPRLDWGHFAAPIEAVAGSELGRPVHIGGSIRFSLVPRTVITASNVTIPDQGDGVYAQIGSLRLEVEIWPLLSGRIVPKRLSLEAPDISLPWRVAGGAGEDLRPLLPRGFSGVIEAGKLTLGHLRLDGINGHVSVDNENGVLLGNGVANLLDRPWRLRATLDHPSENTNAAFTLHLEGSGAANGTHGDMQGVVAQAGTMTGQINAGGPDAAILLGNAAPHRDWQIGGKFSANQDHFNAPDLELVTRGDHVKAQLTVLGGAPLNLDLSLSADHADVEPWRQMLAFAGDRMRDGHIEIRLGEAEFTGGNIKNLVVSLHNKGGAGDFSAHAILPKDGVLAIDGNIAIDPHQAREFQGKVSLRTENFGDDIGFFRHFVPRSLPDFPAAIAYHAELTGGLHFSNTAMTLAGLSGTVDGITVSGGLGLNFSTPSSLVADLTVSQLDVARFATISPPGDGWHKMLAVNGQYVLAAQALLLGGKNIGHASIIASSAETGLSVEKLDGEIEGVKFSAHGGVNEDGSAKNLRVDATIEDGVKFLGLLPPNFVVLPSLWQGPVVVALSADGALASLHLAGRADFGDLRVEAESTVDASTQTASTILTARHPGAPRLLNSLGMSGSESWLGLGSFALRAHVQTSPGHAAVFSNADVRAGNLHAWGDGEISRGDLGLKVTAKISAETLALPGVDALMRVGAGWPWQIDMHVAADQLVVGGHPLAHTVTVDLQSSHGILTIPRFAAAIFGGKAGGSASVDFGQSKPVARAHIGLSDAVISQSLMLGPVSILSGKFGGDLDAQMVGTDSAGLLGGLSGEAVAQLNGATAQGLDSLKWRASLKKHAGAGDMVSAPVTANAGITFAQGVGTLHDGKLIAPGRNFDLAGSVTLSSQNLVVMLAPVGSGVKSVLKVSGVYPGMNAVLVKGGVAKGKKRASK